VRRTSMSITPGQRLSSPDRSFTFNRDLSKRSRRSSCLRVNAGRGSW
jgi:hypothetical protein